MVAPRYRLGVAAAALVVAVAAVVCVTFDASGASGARLSTASPARFQTMLQARLNHLGLNYHRVTCVPSGRSFDGVRVVRCNVDFGEPHIEAYCSVLRNGQLLTSQEDAAIPCAHDNSGMYTPVVTYN